MRKAIVVFDTRFGNTKKVAKTLALELKGQGLEVECVKVEEVEVKGLTEYDLLAVGGPTHRLGISEPMKGFLGKPESADLRGKRAFAFDTRVKTRFAGSAGKRIEKRLKKLGMSIIRSHSSAIVKGREGPLEEGVQETFKHIGEEIAKSVQQGSIDYR